MPIASTGTTANTYLYSGERFDQNIGLYHLRARYYNQGTGRFETMDHELGRIFSPSTLHKYLYAAGNPVNRVDPTGKDDIEEYVFELAEQFHHINFARKLGNCTATGLGVGAAGVGGVTATSGSEEFPGCIAEALWDLLQPPPGIPIPPYPGP
jgi:RHS repeat-associated protein